MEYITLPAIQNLYLLSIAVQKMTPKLSNFRQHMYYFRTSMGQEIRQGLAGSRTKLQTGVCMSVLNISQIPLYLFCLLILPFHNFFDTTCLYHMSYVCLYSTSVLCIRLISLTKGRFCFYT